MRLKEKIVDQIRVVTIEETRLDTDVATEFKRQVVELVESGPPNLLLNMSEVSMIDSRALGILAIVYKATKTRGEFALCDIQKNVQTLLKMTRLDQVFLCFPTETEALVALEDKVIA